MENSNASCIANPATTMRALCLVPDRTTPLHLCLDGNLHFGRQLGEHRLQLPCSPELVCTGFARLRVGFQRIELASRQFAVHPAVENRIHPVAKHRQRPPFLAYVNKNRSPGPTFRRRICQKVPGSAQFFPGAFRGRG